MMLLLILMVILSFLLFYSYFYHKADISTLDAGFAQATVIYDRNGEIASKISANKTEGISIKQMPKHLQDAVIAIEDHRFYEHHGIDYRGMTRAFFQNMKEGEIVQGGSTITQQLTKNALLSPEKTYKRKIEELFLAKKIEKVYTKEQILEMYLNKIYFGEGAWGIKRAGMKYFGKDVNQLTISEAALLAGLIKAPSNLSPYKNIDKARERRNIVLSRMKEFGFIKEEEYKRALKEEIVLNDKSDDPFNGKYPYYVDHILVEAIEKYGFTLDEILTGGFQIYTELDDSMQSAVEKTYKNDRLFPKGTEEQIVQSGAILVDPKTGGIRALVGGRGTHVLLGLNRATQIKRQPGSVMKPLVSYVPALEKGWKITDNLKDEQISFSGYEPKNYHGQYAGKVPMYEAVIKSLNVPSVWLLDEIGIEAGLDSLKRFGIPLEDKDRNLSLALGGMNKGLAPLHLAEAYSVFANKGERIEAHAITKILDSEGNLIIEWQEKKNQVTSKEVVDKMTTMLLGVVELGTGKGAQIPGREVAGKTGSTQVPIEGINGVKDQWFVGYTPQLVGAIWLGYDEPDETHYLTTTSSEGAALIFREMMTEALGNTKAVSFNVPHLNPFIVEKERKEKNRREQQKDLNEKVKKEKEKWEKKVEKEKEKWEKKIKKEKEKWDKKFQEQDDEQ
ncbi:penicillin-binding protein 1A [Bacillus aquiflavi]|uniref:Penicillin-binding protein 1A n=2 Tax=Bacillus aquiflavi TaxID=2672567 RepID=A0A6B3VXD2_9BACI|nr:penicillin-binding protein 1A [Bacillus aquiflavi]NEY80004.1 penicillin-binding protein 1A [Bacillus aquiflavi]